MKNNKLTKISKERKEELKLAKLHKIDAERQRNNMFEIMNNANNRKLCKHGEFNCVKCMSEFLLNI